LDLDSQTTQNATLKREVSDEQRRLALREQDIQGLEVALNDLKENMGAEFAQKSKDFDAVKRAYEEMRDQCEHLRLIISGHRDELESAYGANSELKDHMQALLDKLNYQETVISD
jgi:chromosome segregation ATPase